MPWVIDDRCEASCSLPEAIEALAVLDFNPRVAVKVYEAAHWLRRLNNNRGFLADVLLDRLAGRSSDEIESGYGPQAIVLSPLRSGEHGGMFLRANIWPSASDLCFKNSGARSFAYGVPHDHNFSFLTSGYLGPGYISDYYTYEYNQVTGIAGEDVALRFAGRSALEEGKLMLYRANYDVHSQMPPKSLSVSLNVMHVDPMQSWHDQYGFDLERSEVSRVLSPNATEVFLRTAVASGSGEAAEFAEWVGATHPSERLRLASFEARAGAASKGQARDDVWREGERNGSRMVSVMAKARRAALIPD